MIRERQRARYALERVRSVMGESSQGGYLTWLRKLPAQLHVNGLGQTVAFYLAAGNEREQICRWLEGWLVTDRGIYLPPADLLEAITTGEDSTYRRASTEARALSLWLKRFAEAFLEPGPGDEG